jgi:hypothetical protein
MIAAARTDRNENILVKIVGTMLDMRAKFLLHLRAHLRALEESGHAKANGVEDFHTSSDCGASAAPIAAARRFQLAVSSRRRLRPAAMSS